MNRVKKWRGDLGLSQPGLAKAIGVAPSTISSIESGNGCHGDTMYKLIAFSQGALCMADLVSGGLRASLDVPPPVAA